MQPVQQPWTDTMGTKLAEFCFSPPVDGKGNKIYPTSINQLAGRHWAVRARALSGYKTKMRVLGHSWKDYNSYPLPPVDIQVTLPFTEHRRRDPHNYTGTNVKAIVDALVAEEILVDDTEDYVTILDPIITINPEGMVRVELYESNTGHPSVSES